MGLGEHSSTDPAAPAAIDSREFEGLVAGHVVVLTAIAARLVGNDRADDVVQEALLRAWRRWSTFDPARGTLRAWLAAIVVDRAHRHGYSQRTTALTAVTVDAVRDVDPVDRLTIEAAVRSLPRRQREVIALYYLADLSVDETARVLRLRPGSVKAHLAAARSRLKKEMQSV